MGETDRQERLRAAWADATECPAPETFLGAVFDALPEAERARLDAHAETCPACAAERALALAFDEAATDDTTVRGDVEHVVARLRREAPVAPRVAPRVAEVRPFRARPARLLRWNPALAAAAVFVVLLAGSIGIWRTTAPALPEPPAASGVRGNRLELETPLGDVAALPEAFRWAAVDAAASYRMQLFGVDRSVLFEATTEAPRFDASGELLERIRAAVVYQWQVEAFDADGKRLAWSETARFRVQPAAEE